MRPITLIVAMFTLAIPAMAQEDTVQQLHDVIVVTANRTPQTFSEVARSVTIIGREQIESSPVRTVEDLLARTLSLEVRRRGASGVQTDIGIRGGTFEQTLVLIDGVRTSDPQTGHHNLDIPVNLADIERIEVLRGPGSHTHGPGALGGVINIITRQVADTRVRADLASGEYGLFERSLSGSVAIGPTAHRLTFAQSNSTGYRNNTEFDILSAGYTGRLDVPAGRVNFSARYADKEFGAYKFYSDAFPDEWESTETALVSSSASLAVGPVTVSPKLYWRQHKDDFILDRSRPNWYRNRHTTDQYGAEFGLTVPSILGTSVLTAEYADERMESSSLGDRSRTRTGLFAEQRLDRGRWSVSPSLSAYHYSDRDWEAWPGLAVGFRVSEHGRVFGSVGRSFRVPTFTELFYVSPANIGNPDLQPETAWSYELGTRWWREGLSGEMAVFVRDGRDLIDWARASAADPWQVKNVSEVTTQGIEVGGSADLTRLSTLPVISSVDLRLTLLDSDRASSEYESKYTLDHLKSQVVSSITLDWTTMLSNVWSARHWSRLSGESVFLVDTRVTMRRKGLELFAEVTNLFDKAYVETGSIPMPGRWFRAGIGVEAGYTE